MCFAFDGCSIDECLGRCLNTGCSNATFVDGQCGAANDCSVFSVPAAGNPMLLVSVLLLMTFASFALRRRSLPMAVRAASLVALLGGAAAAVDAIIDLQLSGSWSDGAAQTPGGAGEGLWNANLSVGANGALSGTVELPGFGDVNVATVEGVLRDGTTSGTLRASNGSAVAEFEGTADAHAAQGTYTKTEGGTGSFAWSSD